MLRDDRLLRASSARDTAEITPRVRRLHRAAAWRTARRQRLALLGNDNQRSCKQTTRNKRANVTLVIHAVRVMVIEQLGKGPPGEMGERLWPKERRDGSIWFLSNDG